MGSEKTFYATPELSTDQEIASSVRKIEAQELFKKTLDSLPEILMILNRNRQIIYLNKAIFKLLGISDFSACNFRQGELFNCINASSAPGGCGTSKFCSVCGFINSVLECQKTGSKSEHEWHLTRKDSLDALELRVTASPLTIEDETFTIATLEDISNEKRGQALERIFFHDIMNLAGGIQGISSMFNNNDPVQVKSLAGMISTASNFLVDEIKAQRQLKQAEKGELPVLFESLDSIKIIKDTAMIYKNHEVAEGKSILEEGSDQVHFESDRTILMRVLGNMLKNALEATPEGGTVRIACVDIPDSGEVEFRISNAGLIPSNAQLQIFQRSFSTKGEGRGLGTYSIKLLGERYLKGKVGFESSESSETSFYIRLTKNAAV
ncbi:MAG: hypothetical protein A2X49_11065 [Lentisphaerae bacterium GWF2_52_8]|nr:MAG: hypothetical protein A2X49_11065 [Lentisphaerae bacterium GWF2_52_8]